MRALVVTVVVSCFIGFVACSDSDGGSSSSSSSGSIEAGVDGGAVDAANDSAADAADDAVADADAVIGVGSACVALAAHFCQARFGCSPISAAILNGSVAACLDVEKRRCERIDQMVGVKAFGASCVPAAGGGGAATPDCDGFTVYTSDACALGTLAIDSVCEDGRQCASGYCAITSQEPTPCGKCAPALNKLSLNANCGIGSNGYCGPGTTCINDVCKKPQAKDATCSTHAQCAHPLRCGAGTCKDPLPANAPCTVADGDQCDAANGYECVNSVCKLLLPLAKAGATCGPSNYCSAEAVCDQGMCVAKGNEGSACVPFTPPGCNDPYECINNKCTAPNPNRCQ